MPEKLELIKIAEHTKISLSDNGTYQRTTYEIGDYEVEHLTITYEDGTVRDTVSVCNAYRLEYTPEIYFEAIGTSREFLIQTKSYGELDPEEIKQVIEGFQQAVEVVEILTNKFC